MEKKITPADVITRLREKDENLFVRWSVGPAVDMQPGARSKDYSTGEVHAGLSAIRLEAGDAPSVIAQRMAEYQYMALNPEVRAHVYRGDQIGVDSDGASSIRPREYLGTLNTEFADSVNRIGTRALTVKEDVDRYTWALENRNDVDEGVRTFWENALGRASRELDSLTPEERAVAAWFDA